MAGAPAIWLAAVAFIASKIAQDLLRKEQETPLIDEKPPTSSTRGSTIPLLGGRRRLGAFVAWVGKSNPYTTVEASAGGKGTTSSGGVTQIVYHGDAHHFIGIGPSQTLLRIWSNAKVIYEPAGGITQQSHPSGSTVTIPGFGSFTVYWGEADQPVNEFLAATSKTGIRSRWKFCIRIVWTNVRLGGFPTWPAIEYEWEVRPYKPGNLMGSIYDSLPDRLSNSAGWLDNEVGPDPATILGILDGFTHAEVLNGGTILVINNKTAEFPAGSKAKITGQNFPPFPNKLLSVVSSTYNAAQNYFLPHGYIAGDDPLNYTGTLTDASWVKTNLTVTLSGVSAPPGVTPYSLVKTGSNPHTVVWNATHVTTGDRKLSRFRNRIRFYVRSWGIGGIDSIKIGFIPFTTGPLVEHQHLAELKFIGGQTVFVEDIAHQAKLQEILPPPDANWRLFDLTYVAGHGATPSNDTYDVQVSIDITDMTNSGVILGNVGWKRDHGTISSGVTTIDFVERIQRVDDNVGQIQSYRAGFGPGGPNAAHLIDQYLFETFPHGAGLDRSQFDIESLEAVGEALEAEGLRTHIIGTDGKDWETIIAEIFLDAGILCGWDRILGKFKFTLIRNPNLLPSIPLIPEELISDPLPERVSIRESKAFDKGVFVFPDSSMAYRDNTIVTDDDGRAAINQNQDSTSTQLKTVIDVEAAVKVSERRAQEALVPASKYSLTVLRDAGDFYPGQVIRAHDFDEILRVMEVRVDPKTRKTILDVIADTYSLEAITVVFAQSTYDPGPDMPEPDASVALVEIPSILLKGNARAIGALRIRESSIADTAAVWISNDDLTYKKITDNSRYVTGGILLEDVASGLSDIVTGPVIYAIGPDMAALAQTLNNADWALGRQLLWIDDEICFLQDVVVLGENYYRLDGIKRKQYRSINAAHTAGTHVYIVDPNRIDALHDPLIKDSQMVYIKSQPRALSEAVALVDVVAVSKTMAVSGPTSPILNFAEIPSGAIDGVNDTFLLSFSPNPASSLMLFLNSTYKSQGNDYTISGSTITMLTGSIPQTGDSLIAALYQG